jgi:hypothetical protein
MFEIVIPGSTEVGSLVGGFNVRFGSDQGLILKSYKIQVTKHENIPLSSFFFNLKLFRIQVQYV